MNTRYDDIINLPRHVSSHRTPMPLKDRAAQFSPFAALSGHAEAIQETSRLTEKKINLNEDMTQMLNVQLHRILSSPQTKPVTLTYFKPDSRKEGGTYIHVTGYIRKLCQREQTLVLDTGEIIPLAALLKITRTQ